jgi:hypothetical protein
MGAAPGEVGGDVGVRIIQTIVSSTCRRAEISLGNTNIVSTAKAASTTIERMRMAI